MRARKVHEAVNFERGQDPKSAMGIGKVEDLKKIDKWVNPPDTRHYYTAIEDGYYEGSLVVVYESIDATPTHYSAVTMDSDGRIREGNFVESPEMAWIDAKARIRMENHRRETGYYDAMGESVNFERGRDPKQAMGIGVIDKIDWDFDLKNDKFYKVLSVYEFIEDWKGYPILVLKVQDKETGEIGYIATSIGAMGRTNFNVYGPQRVLKNMRNTIKRRHGPFQHTFESVNFVRGQDPKAAMGIGAINNMPEIIFKAALDSNYEKGYQTEQGRQIIDIIATKENKLYITFDTRDIKNIKTGGKANILRIAEEIMKAAGIDKLFKYFTYSPKSRHTVMFFLKDGHFKLAEYEPYDFGLDPE